MEKNKTAEILSQPSEKEIPVQNSQNHSLAQLPSQTINENKTEAEEALEKTSTEVNYESDFDDENFVEDTETTEIQGKNY